MSTTIGWQEITLRLALTLVAGAIIGFNRSENGRPAGFRTTVLVCLAAAISMIQMNILLSVGGKRPDSFGVMDVMRLPLGILSGMGFIGAGAILRKDDLILGVTTAATLWFSTVMGLCFGGGQIQLGLIALGLGLLVLTVFKWVEESWKEERRATLVLTCEQIPTDEEIATTMKVSGFKVTSWGVAYLNHDRLRKITCEVKWRAKRTDWRPPPFLDQFSHHPKVAGLDWKPIGSAH